MVSSRFKFLVEDYHLDVAEKSVVYGQIDNFYTLISFPPQSNLFFIMLGARPGPDAASIEPFFKEIENLPTIQTIEQKAATIVIKGKVTLKKCFKQFVKYSIPSLIHSINLVIKQVTLELGLMMGQSACLNLMSIIRSFQKKITS